MKILPLQLERAEEMVECWNETLWDELPMRPELFQQNTVEDPNVYLPACKMALDDKGQLIGFVIAKRKLGENVLAHEKELGWIQALLVKEAFRNKGIGSELLHLAEKALVESGARRISLGKDLLHYLPGIPVDHVSVKKWFTKRGYVLSGPTFDLFGSFSPEDETVNPSFEDAEFSILAEEEKAEFIEFMERIFPDRWALEAHYYFQKGGTGREFIVAKKAGKIIGFCRINDEKSPVIGPNLYWAPLFEESIGGVGPLGIDDAERGHGYGLAVVQAGVHALRQRGIDHMVIDWTEFADFYGKLGFKVWKTYEVFNKDV